MDSEIISDRAQVVAAKEVYVLMNGKCSVSRNARATWYLKYLNNILPYNQNGNTIADDDEFEIVSAIKADNVDADDDVNALSFILEPTTVVTFIAHRYSLAFVLDLSSSLSSLDSGPDDIVYPQVYLTLYDTLKVLVRPFKPPGATSASGLLRPHIYVTVVGVTSTTTCKAKHVLVHGCILSESNLEEVMEKIRRELSLIETKIATSMKAVVPGYDEVSLSANDLGDIGSVLLDNSFTSNDGVESTYPLDVSLIHSSPDVHFLVLLRYGFLALQLLADNSMMGIVLITDGVVGLPDTTLLDLMLQQMRHDAIACSSIQLKSICQAQYGFGLVPHPELLQFIATATSGTYYPLKPRLMETGDPSMNSVHKGLLTQTFYKALNVGPGLLLTTSDMFQELPAESRAFLTLDERIWSVPMLQKKHWERVLHVPIGVVLACRLREGYFVRRVYIVTNNKGEKQIKVRLMLPWRDNVKINYVAVAPWPLSSTRPITQVEVITEATYNFFDDSIVASMLHPPASSNVLSKSAYRKAVVKKYLQEIKLIMSTDQRLEHLQSFNTNPQFFSVPEALRHGVPLLVLPGSGRLFTDAQLNPQLNIRDIEPFAKFWQPIMFWEVSSWQKWFHVKRISLLLDHDMPLSKHLHTPNSSGRYNIIYCRQSMKILLDLLHHMSSFTLAENHTYVTLLYSESERVPVSFYVLRVDLKPPCLMLKLSFLGGTSGKLRKRVLAQLKSDILALRFPLPVAPKPPPTDVIGMWKHRASNPMEIVHLGRPPRHPSEERALSDRACCIITRNPLNMILIKYEKPPSDFTKTGSSTLANKNEQTASTANRVMLNKFVLLSTSLHHFRWIWSVNKDASVEISTHAIGRLLSVLTRSRLCEGFRFANSDSGMHNLAIELDLKHTGVADRVNSCIVQFIIFPPSKVVLGDSFSDDGTVCYSGPVPETDGEEEQSVITECWIEPRDGVVCNSSAPLSRLDGLKYTEIPQALFSSDVECISTLLTFERLVLMCQNACLLSSSNPDKGASKAQGGSQKPTPGAPPTTFVTGSDGNSSVQCDILTETSPGVTSDTTVSYVKLSCDLPRVLSKCQCVRLQFSTLRPSPARESHQENSARATNNLLLTLLVDQLRQLNDMEYSLSDRESFAILQLLRDRVCTANSGRSSSSSDLYCGPPVKWHCFVRSISSSHLVVSLVPANYSDLLVIAPAVLGMNDKRLSKYSDLDSSVEKGEIMAISSSILQPMKSDSPSCAGQNGPEQSSIGCNKVPGTKSAVAADERLHAQSTPKSSSTGGDSHPSESSIDDDSLLLPIFVFDCRLNVLCDQIACPWIQSRPEDVVDDMTFQNEAVLLESTKSDEQVSGTDIDLSKSPREAQQFRAPEYGRPRRANERSTSGSSLGGGSRKRCNSSNLYGALEDLQNHCTLISETFLRCFVIGVYRSLLLGLWVDCSDVEEAINGVCEELQPIEIDITTFIQSSCRATHQLMDVRELLASLLQSNEASSPSALPVVTEVTADDASSIDDLDKTSVKLPLASLTGAHQCELSAGLHQQTHNKFLSIVGQFFKPVPSNKDYLFYCFTGVVSRRSAVSSSFTMEDDIGLLSASTTEQKVSGRYADTQLSGVSQRSTYVRGSASSSGSSDTSGSVGQSSNIDPLFVHLVCSVHYESSLKSKAVCSLPLCFGELQDCISELISSPEIDLNNVRVTLDMICLTLPSAEEDLKQSTGRPCYNRWTSYSSQTSVTAVDVDVDSDDVQSPVRNVQNEFMKHGPFQQLPTQQKLSVQACRDQISWLLRDEIVSSMRLLNPVSVEVLATVCNHIKVSPGQSSCESAEVSLHFVYGAQESMQLFEKDLEKVRIAGRYRFCKIDEFYYLCRDRCSFTQDESSLRHISGMSSVRSPVNVARLEVSFEKSPLTTQSSSKDEPCCEDDKANESCDISGVHEHAASPKDIRLSTLSDELLQKDIQIHVQRPSPVREIVPRILPDEVASAIDVPGSDVDKNCKAMSTSSDTTTEDSANSVMKLATVSVDAMETVSSRAVSAEVSESAAVMSGNNSKTCIELPPVMEMASSPESAGSAKETDGPRRKDSDSNRVRPISGPADMNFSCSTEFDSVRKSRSVTDDLDESPRELFPVRGCGQLKRGNLTHRLQESLPASVENRASVSIRRIHSNVSFDGLNGRRTCIAGLNEADVSSSGNAGDSPRVQSRQASGSGVPDSQSFSDLRARHTSGLDTPISFIDTTSVASTGEGGYEGDWSDNEDELGAASCSDSISGHWRVLAVPDFWLILRVRHDGVMVYFQTRDIANSGCRPQTEVYPQVIRTVKNICHTINQKLLLEDLYKTKHCNMLLVPKADEDVRWVQDKAPPSGTRRRRQMTVNSESDDSDEDGQNDKYLAATLQFQPGHFACKVVATSHFVLHPRLKAVSLGPQRAGQPGHSPGLAALLTVLDKFRVSDRRNMFVIKENKSGAVFYIRLSEFSHDIRTPGVNSEQEDPVLSVSQNPSMLSMALKRLSRVEDPVHVASCIALDSDGELGTGNHQSLARRGSVGFIPPKYGTEERITLSVHGICEVGDEISKDLIKMLKKRLDDAVLDNLTLNLSRNQMHKLTFEDVQFIQKPNTNPNVCLQLLVPSSAVLHQSALGHYLRQNLLQFMFIPKYQEGGRPENVFQDYTAPGGSSTDSDVYLYRPQMGGSKGMACVFLSFVDGKGSPVNLLASPKPLPANYKEPVDRAMYDSVLQVIQYKPSSGSASKSPGPTSLIQFKAWLCGTVDEEQLENLLIQSTQHAVCDIILEYRLLTAPICEVPPHYCKGMMSPMHSAPVSPNSSTPNVDMQQGNTTSIGQSSGTRALPDTYFRGAIKTPKETSSSVHSLFDSVKVSNVYSSTQDKDSSLSDISSGLLGEACDDKRQQQERRSLLQKIAQYENGERGFLNPVFSGALRDWLEHCFKLGVPAVAKYQYHLLTRFAIDIVLRETVSTLNNISPDSGTAVFRSRDMFNTLQMSSSGEGSYVRYSPQRQTSSASQTRDSRSLSEVNLDFTKTVGAGHPGRGYSYIVICRNFDQWRSSLYISERDAHLVTPSKGGQRSQKFQSMDSTTSNSPYQTSSINTTPASTVPPLSGGHVGSMFTMGSSTSLSSLDHVEKSFVPRQKLFLLFVEDKKVTVYMYNWMTEHANQFDKQLLRQILWHNARSHFVSCVALQKIGLFHHITFSELPADISSTDRNISQDRNMFVQSEADLDSLIKVQNPSSTQILVKLRNRSGTMPTSRQSSTVQPLLSTAISPVLYMDSVYRDVRPPVPMHRVNGIHLRDLIYKHGMQVLELRSLEKKEIEKREKLDKVYSTWQQRMGSTHPEITEEVLELLKKSSRITHCVLTPFLFIPAWRHEAMLKIDQSKKPETALQPTDNKQRSRNNSGTSVRSKRSDSIDSMAAGGVATKTLSSSSLMELLQRHLRSEESWHMSLRRNFTSLYMQYLQQPGAGFQQVQVVAQSAHEPLNRSSSSSRQPSVGSIQMNDLCCYMEKTLPGGILLIELSFREVYFCVNIYTYECSRMLNGKRLNSQLALLFTDECDKIKDLTHIHSFAYDFYLREIQSFINGSSARLGPQYHLTAFLHDFVAHYSVEPVFARNLVHEEVISLQCDGITGQQLFEFMKSHDKKYGLATIYMASCPFVDAEMLEKEQFALVFRPSRVTSLSSVASGYSSERYGSENYEVGIVMTMAHKPVHPPADLKSTTDSSSSLQLRFWVIMTNQQEVFPRLTLENKHGMMPHPNLRKQSLSTVLREGHRFNVEELQTSLSVEKIRKSSMPNAVSQGLIYSLLKSEAKLARDAIVSMVDSMKVLCRRDLLWNRLVFISSMDEPETRRRRRTGDDDFKDPLPRLTYAEFCSLLELVTRVDLCDFDPSLRQLVDLPIGVFQSLVRVIVSRYPDMHRVFTGPEGPGGSVQYVAIVNRSYVDAFPLLCIDTPANKIDICIVFHDEDILQKIKKGSLEIPKDTIFQNVEMFVNLCCYHVWTSLATASS